MASSVILRTRVSPDTDARYRAAAARRNMTLAEYVRFAVDAQAAVDDMEAEECEQRGRQEERIRDISLAFPQQGWSQVRSRCASDRR